MVVGHSVFVFVFVFCFYSIVAYDIVIGGVIAPWWLGILYLYLCFCFSSIVAYDIIIGGVIAPWWLGSTTVEIPNQWQNADMIIAQLSTS